MTSKIDSDGLSAARRYAMWHIGDRIWANRIIEAYLNPEEAHRLLDEEMDG